MPPRARSRSRRPKSRRQTRSQRTSRSRRARSPRSKRRVLRGGASTQTLAPERVVLSLIELPLGTFLDTIKDFLAPSIFDAFTPANLNLGAAMLNVPYGEPQVLAHRANAIVNAMRNAKHLDLSAPAASVLPIPQIVYAMIGINPSSYLKGGVEIEEENCGICFTSFQDDPRSRGEQLQCGHNGMYHSHCLQMWLDTSRQRACPYCRAPVRPNPPRQVVPQVQQIAAQPLAPPNRLVERQGQVQYNGGIIRPGRNWYEMRAELERDRQRIIAARAERERNEVIMMVALMVVAILSAFAAVELS
jgi:hypothetical protein